MLFFFGPISCQVDGNVVVCLSSRHINLGLFVKQTCRSQLRFCKAFHTAGDSPCLQEIFICTLKLEKNVTRKEDQITK